jgi:hypothetical protein
MNDETRNNLEPDLALHVGKLKWKDGWWECPDFLPYGFLLNLYSDGDVSLEFPGYETGGEINLSTEELDSIWNASQLIVEAAEGEE